MFSEKLRKGPVAIFRQRHVVACHKLLSEMNIVPSSWYVVFPSVMYLISNLNLFQHFVMKGRTTKYLNIYLSLKYAKPWSRAAIQSCFVRS